MSDKLKVMLTTEGTYPFHQGGVSNWCDILVNQLQSVDYVIYSVITDPFITQKFKLPDTAEMVRVPLWGTEEPSEHLKKPFSQIFMAKQRTTGKVVKEHFIPLFTELIKEIIQVEKNPLKFGEILNQLYLYFQRYEYKKTFKSQVTWESYKDIILNYVKEGRIGLAQPDVYSLIQSVGWVYRFLTILNTPVPKTHVSHASAAAFCGIPCVIAKLQHNTPFMLTEHGVYVREQYLSLSKREYPSFLNTFLIRFIHSITSLNYAYADQISPVCFYNTRWEQRFNVDLERIQVIHNGVDRKVFAEADQLAKEQPTVVTVARIDPIKDIHTLIRSAAIVREKVPDVKFIVYGSVSVPDYYEECLVLRDQLGLSDIFIFAGHTSNMVQAYQSGDIIALSSISEAFPYSVVEAMMVGKPTISTDVGGIKEAVGDTGVLVRPRDPEGMAEGIIKLFRDEGLRKALGRDARERALNLFTLEKVLDQHLKSYLRLALTMRNHSSNPPKIEEGHEHQKHYNLQHLYAERAYALLASQYLIEAIEHFRMAIDEDPTASSVPVFILEIASIYKKIGEMQLYRNEMEKYEAMLELQKKKRLA